MAKPNKGCDVGNGSRTDDAEGPGIHGGADGNVVSMFC